MRLLVESPTGGELLWDMVPLSSVFPTQGSTSLPVLSDSQSLPMGRADFHTH